MTYGDVALPELAIKIVPYIDRTQDTGLCRIMNVNTKQFLFAGEDYISADFERREISCGELDSGLEEENLNWRFEEKYLL